MSKNCIKRNTVLGESNSVEHVLKWVEVKF